MNPHPIPAGRAHVGLPVHAAFERIAEAHPDRVAAVFGEARLTYGELNEKANQLAHALIAQGIRIEHRVGVCLRPGLEILIALLAIQKSGGTYLPIDPDYPKARIKTIVEDAELEFTLAEEGVIERVGDVLVRPSTFAQLEATWDASQRDNPALDIREENTAYVFYTSGTTGQPKGIALSHQALAYYVFSAIDQFGLTVTDVTLTIAKYSFSISLFDLLTSILSGGQLRILPRDDIMDYARLSRALEGATVVHIGPNLLKGLTRYIKSSYKTYQAFGGLRHVSSGGDFVPPELLEDLKRIFHRAEIYIIYGCTEIACMGCFYPVPRDVPVEQSFIGKPFAETECVLLSDEGALAAPGEIGEICFHGPGLMKGYLNKPDLTRQAFIAIDGHSYFRTGDLGRVHPSGNLEYLGRRDFQIKLRGQRIELVEIEGQLRLAPGVRDAVVAAMEIGSPPDSRLIAYITVEDPQALSIDAIRGYLQEHLPDYMIPTGWMVLDQMPLNENFKIARKALPTPVPGDLIVSEPYAAPRDEAERLLQGIWQEALNLPCVGIHDHFFHIGGDSLLGMNVCMLAAEHGIQISPSQLVTAPTIAELAAAGVGRKTGPTGLPSRPPSSGVLRDLTPFILHFLHERGPQIPHRWNVSRVMVAKTHLTLELIQKTFACLGHRHDALRLRFDREADRWRATVLESPTGNLACRRVDLSGLAEAKQREAMAEVADACEEEVNLIEGPIAAMVLFDLGDGRPQELFFVVHHFAMDVVSWKVFWLEFESVYRRLESGREEDSYSPSCSFEGWAEVLRGHAGSPGVEGDVQRWLRQDWAEVPPLPKDLGDDPKLNTNGSAQTVRLTLSRRETQTLLRSGAQGPDAECILMGGLAVALNRWQGGRVVHFDRLVHGRNVAPAGFDLSRTMGCIISYAPTLIDIDPVASVDRLLLHVAEQMKGAGEAGTSAELYRYLGADPALLAALKGLPRADVLINYRGKVDDFIDRSTLFQSTYEIAGLDHNPKGLRRYSIAIVIDLIDDELLIRFVYSQNLHARASIEALAADCSAFLRSALNR